MNKWFLSLILIAPATHASCYVASNNLNFGTYDPSSNLATTSMAQIDIRCDTLSNLTIELGDGLHSVNQQQRRMLHETRDNEFLNYSLSQDAAHTQNWGLISQGAALQTGAILNQQKTIYGIIPAGQQPWVGQYHDQVSLTILP